MARPPKVAVFVLSSKCNMKCEFCVCQDEGDLSTDYVKSEIDSLPKSIDTVIFTGGEPALRADLGELIQYAHPKYKVSVVTNAILFDRIEPYLKYINIVNLPIDDTLRKDNAHDAMRMKGHLSTITNIIDKLANANQNITLTTCLTDLNKDRLDNISRYLEQYSNIKSWRIYRFRSIGKGAKNSYLNISDQDYIKAKQLKTRIKMYFIDDIKDESGFLMFEGKK